MISACEAAAEGSVSKLKSLAIKGVDLSEADYDKRTPLHLAAFNGRLDAVKYIIDLTKKVNPYDRWGSTPLDDSY